MPLELQIHHHVHCIMKQQTQQRTFLWACELTRKFWKSLENFIPNVNLLQTSTSQVTWYFLENKNTQRWISPLTILYCLQNTIFANASWKSAHQVYVFKKKLYKKYYVEKCNSTVDSNLPKFNTEWKLKIVLGNMIIDVHFVCYIEPFYVYQMLSYLWVILFVYAHVCCIIFDLWLIVITVMGGVAHIASPCKHHSMCRAILRHTCE